MDRVRLGRVLGRGARLAARTAMEAVDAATAPGPANGRASQSTTAGPIPTRPRATGTATPEILTPQRRSQPQAARMPAVNMAQAMNAATAASAGVLSPLKSASRALWHELTGSFFALFALSFGVAVWKTRASAASAIAADRNRFLIFCGLALIFSYFSISSFVRARRRN